MSIHSEILDLFREIEVAQNKIALLQQKCSHPIEARNTLESRSNDEWDSHAHYTAYHHCTICEFSWSEDVP